MGWTACRHKITSPGFEHWRGIDYPNFSRLPYTGRKMKCCKFTLGYTTPFFSQKFVELDILMENLSQQTPLYVITEGSEPQYFTRFFTWDSAKSAVSTFILYYNVFDIV